MLIAEQFERAVRRFPDRLFVISADGDLTHWEMADRVGTVANAIARQGLSADSNIALLTPNHPLGMVCQLAILKTGCVWVPCNYPQPGGGHDPPSDGAGRALAVLSQQPRGARCRRPPRRPGTGRHHTDRPPDHIGTCNARLGGRVRAGRALPERGMDDAVSIISSGGTTGVPKGAVHTNRTYEANTAGYWAAFDFSTPPVHLVTAPLTHAAGVIYQAMVGTGATHVLSPSADPEVMLELIQRHRVTILFLPPTIIYMLLAHPKLKQYDCSSVRDFLFGAAPMSVDKLQEAIGHFGPVFCHLYGSTETLVMNTILPPGELADALAHPAHARRVASCGREGPFARVEIIDDDGKVLPPNQRGEIAIRGGFVMQGYYKEPEKTAATRINGWHRMGDIGVKDEDGYVYIVDRKSDMIITGGFNVFPAEVEQIVLAHPAVQDCVVVGIPHEKWGEAILAVVELKAGCNLDKEELIARCKAELGSVRAPKAVEIVDALPRSTVGKTLRRAVRAPYWEGRSTAI